MARVREEMLKMKEIRKPESLRRVDPDNFPDQEVRRVKRRESSRWLERRGSIIDEKPTHSGL